MINIIKQIRYIFEAIIVVFASLIFLILGEKNASNFGSFLARKIGKKHYANKLASQNLSRAMPELSENKDEILDEMWDNLGRVVGEYIHVAKQNPQNLVEKYITIDAKTAQNIKFLQDLPQKGGIIFSAHIGNWEIGPKFFMNYGFNVGTVYRPLNNPYVEKMTASVRGSKLIAKGAKGGREIIEVIKKGGYVIILVDQKVSEGEPVRFFHDDAITTTSLARMALKYNVPLIPARAIRIGHQFKFEVEVEKPLVLEKTENLQQDLLSVTRLINAKLEDWIKQYPAQWFWVHNRWKK